MEAMFNSQTNAKTVTVHGIPVEIWRRAKRMAVSQNLTLRDFLVLLIKNHRLTESEEQ